MRYFLAVVLAVGCLSSSLAPAAPLDDKVAALQDAMKTEKASQAPGADTAGAPTIRPEMLLAALGGSEQNSFEPYGSNNLETIVNQILATYSSDAVHKAAEALLQEIRDERKAKSDAYTAQVQDVFKRLKDVVNNAAAKASDLDPILVDLQKARNASPQGLGPEIQSLSQQVNEAYPFATAWQDYLNASAAGHSEQARTDLVNLAQNSFGITLIPRSQILDRQQNLTGVPEKGVPGTPADIVAGLQNLDDMEPALKTIDAMGQGNIVANGGAVQALRHFVDMYTHVKSGLPEVTGLSYFFNTSHMLDNPVLESKLLIFILQSQFKSYQGPPPVEGEKPSDFVDAVIQDAQKREDWHLLREAIDIEIALSRDAYGAPVYSNPIAPFLIAQNQEEAGQYAQAVASYESSLQSESPYVPAKIIGERLAAIQKDHPQEYAAGLQTSSSRNSPPGGFYRGGGMPMSAPGTGLPASTPISPAAPRNAPLTSPAPYSPASSSTNSPGFTP